MALFDTSGGLGGLLGDLGDYGFGLPSNTGGLVADPDREAINKRALLSGLISAGLTYAATPKNLNTGSALPYLGKAGLAGFNTSQDVVDRALNTAYRNQILSARDDKLYNVDGALVDKAGKVVYQGAAKEKEVKTDIIDVGGKKILINKDTGAPIQEYKVTGGGLGLKDIYGEPQKDVNGKLLYIPKIPGYPVRDMGGNVIQGDIKLPEKAGEKLTEGERTAGFLSKRLNNSLQQLQTVTGQEPSAASPNIGAEATKFFTRSDYFKNLVNPESRQRVEAAQYDILDSALTLGTGAAYTEEQIKSYRKSYFPQLGDKPKTIEDKAKRLQGVLDAAYDKAGRAAPTEPKAETKSKTVVRTGKDKSGKTVIQYSDGSIEYGN